MSPEEPSIEEEMREFVKRLREWRKERDEEIRKRLLEAAAHKEREARAKEKGA